MLTQDDDDQALTIDAACKMIGGDRPISRATFYRGSQKGIFPKPYHPSEGVSRISRNQLIAAIRARKAS